MKNDFHPRDDVAKWNVQEGELPLTVADMDLMTASPIIEALKEKVGEGVYGYADIPARWYDAYISFYHDLYGWDIEKDSLHFIFSIVAAIYVYVGALTNPGDQVILFSPVYHHFYSPITNSDRVVREVPLIYKEGEYFIDFEELEVALQEEKTTLLVLCNPHNPVGKIFSVEEMEEVIRLCKKHGVTILSDEIHGPITSPNVKYNPILKIPGAKEVAVVAISPSKAFNLAGLHTAALVLPEPSKKEKVLKYLDKTVYEDPNILSCLAAIKAYDEGRDWLQENNLLIYENRIRCEEYLAFNLPLLHLVHGEATYLLWIDCREVCGDSKKFVADLRRFTGLILAPGVNFGTGGEGFVRMNVAIPKEELEDALSRLNRGVREILK